MRARYQNIIEQVYRINWMLLIFLLLILNVKMAIKCAVLIIFLILFRKKITEYKFLQQKFWWFYCSMIIISLLNLVINIPSHTPKYLVAAAAGIGFWLMCISAAAIIWSFVNRNESAKLHATISAFFILNSIFTIVQLATFMWDAGSLNPYTYQGMNQKYFISTGDLLRGITLDVSTTNAVLNAIAALYFLDRRKLLWLILCLGTMLLTASNLSNLLLLVILIFLFIFQSDRNQKSAIVICLGMFIIFFSKVSPQNKNYLNYVWQKISDRKIDTILPVSDPPLISSLPDTILTEEDKKRKIAMLFLDSVHAILVKKKEEGLIAGNNLSQDFPLKPKPSIPKPDIHTATFQRLEDTSAFHKDLVSYATGNITGFDTSWNNNQETKLPGKLIAVKQTVEFLKDHPLKILTGMGIGQFSSKLAFRATGLNIAGGYPSKFIYINPDFRDNHLSLHLNYFTKDSQFHSLMNTPDSVYDQLLAEYGFAGIICFLLFYVGYFTRNLRKKTYGLPLLLLMAGILAMGYWFEQLSVVIIFELLMIVNSTKRKEQPAV